MNKKILLILFLFSFLLIPSCAGRPESSTEETEMSGENKGYTEILSDYDIGRVSPVTHFSLRIEGASEESELSFSYAVSKSDDGYNAVGEDGETFSCEGDITDDFMKRACYLPPCDCTPEEESSGGATTFTFYPDPGFYRETLLSISSFFDGYENISEENAEVSNIIYTAHESNGVLTDYEYSYDIAVYDDGFSFSAKVKVKINL